MNKGSYINIIEWTLITLVILLFVIGAIKMSSTISPKQTKQKEELVEEQRTNYVFGYIESIKVIDVDGKIVTRTVIRHYLEEGQVLKTYDFCDDMREIFQGTGFVVLDYDREIHEGKCYELLRFHKAFDRPVDGDPLRMFSF